MVLKTMMLLYVLLNSFPEYSADYADGSGKVLLAEESVENYQIEFETGSAQLDYALVPEVFVEETIAVAQTPTDLLTLIANGNDFTAADAKNFSISSLSAQITSNARSTDEAVDDKITTTALTATREKLTNSGKMDQLLTDGYETLFAADESHGSHVSPFEGLSFGNNSDRMWQLADTRQQAEGTRSDRNQGTAAELRKATAAATVNNEPERASNAVYRPRTQTTTESIIDDNADIKQSTRTGPLATSSDEQPIWAPTVRPLVDPMLGYPEISSISEETTSHMVRRSTAVTTATSRTQWFRSLQQTLGFLETSTLVPFGIDAQIWKVVGAQTTRSESTDSRIPAAAPTYSGLTGTDQTEATTSDWPPSATYLITKDYVNNIDNTITDAEEKAREHEDQQEHKDLEQEQHFTSTTLVTDKYDPYDSRREDTVISKIYAVVENDDLDADGHYAYASRSLSSDSSHSKTTVSSLSPDSTLLWPQESVKKFPEAVKPESKQTEKTEEIGLHSSVEFNNLSQTSEASDETASDIARTTTSNLKQLLGKNITGNKLHLNTYSNAETTDAALGMTYYSKNTSYEVQSSTISHFLLELETDNAYSVTQAADRNTMDTAAGDINSGRTVMDFHKSLIDVTSQSINQSHNRTLTPNLDGQLIKVALTLKLQSNILFDDGGMKNSQKFRKLRFSLEHQLNKLFVECPGYVRSEISTFRTGSILAEGNLLFDATFLLFDPDVIERIIEYVIRFAVPQMTSPTPFGRIDPEWATTLRQRLLELRAQLVMAPCECLDHICGLCFHCRHNETAIWCQADCDLQAHRTCVADDFRFRSMDSRCVCIESYVNVGGRCLDYRVILAPLVAMFGITLVATLALVSLMLSRGKIKTQSSSIRVCNLSRNRVDHLLSTRASIWRNPTKNGDVRKKKCRRFRCHDDIITPTHRGFMPTSSPTVTVAKDKLATGSSGTFLTFGKQHQIDGGNAELKNDGVMRTRVNSGVTQQSNPDEIIPRSVRTRQSEDSLSKDELLASLLRNNSKQRGRGGEAGETGRRGGEGEGESSTNDEDLPSSQRFTVATNTTAQQPTLSIRLQPGFNYSSFYI